MKVRVHPGGILRHAPVEIPAESVVVYDDYDQPVMVAQRQGAGSILIIRAGEPKFAELLQVLGIGTNLTVTTSPLR